jgi:hypothetical protein
MPFFINSICEHLRKSAATVFGDFFIPAQQ